MPTRDQDEELERIDHDWEPRSWPHAEAMEALREVNEACLELLVEQSMARTAHSHVLLRELAADLRSMDAGARRRAASCPFLLVDCAFADPSRWRGAGSYGVSEPSRSAPAAFFTVARTGEVTNLVLTYAWHLSRTQQVAARMVLGVPGCGAPAIAGCTLRQMQEFGKRCPGWLQPRWPDRTRIWRELIAAANSGEALALEQVHMRGLQILAGLVRAAPARMM